MAISRINPKCSECGENIKGLYADRGKNFIGDTFLNWDYSGHKCGSKLLKKKETKTQKLKRVVVEQALTISKLTSERDDLKDTDDRRKEWLWKAKKEAGYNDSMSFDNVWREVLEKA